MMEMNDIIDGLYSNDVDIMLCMNPAYAPSSVSLPSESPAFFRA
jgi:hypothetical protein